VISIALREPPEIANRRIKIRDCRTRDEVVQGPSLPKKLQVRNRVTRPVAKS
jgi:hypothetical protein